MHVHDYVDVQPVKPAVSNLGLSTPTALENSIGGLEFQVAQAEGVLNRVERLLGKLSPLPDEARDKSVGPEPSGLLARLDAASAGIHTALSRIGMALDTLEKLI